VAVTLDALYRYGLGNEEREWFDIKLSAESFENDNYETLAAEAVATVVARDDNSTRFTASLVERLLRLRRRDESA